MIHTTVVVRFAATGPD